MIQGRISRELREAEERALLDGGAWRWETPHASFFGGRRRTDSAPVLVKLPSEEANEAASGALERDYRIAQRLRSDAAVKPFDLGRASGRRPLLLYADDGDVPIGKVAAELEGDVDRILAIGEQLALALASLHQEEVVHFNLNPDTVWLNPATGRVRIADFSCASHPLEPAPRLPALWDRLTDVRYIAPEQTGRVLSPVDRRADLYAFGVLLFRLAVGEAPFEGRDAFRIAEAHVSVEPRFPATAAARLPADFVALVLQALRKAPEQRYQTAAGLLSDLRELRHGSRSSVPFQPGRHDRTQSLRRAGVLHGRDAELDDVFRFALQRGTAAGLIMIDGAPGIGKTTFAGEIQNRIRSSGGICLAAKFDQYKRAVPYLTLNQAVQPLIASVLGLPPPAFDRFVERIKAAAEGNSGVLTELMPQLVPVVGEQPPPPSLPPTDARNRLNYVFARFIALFVAADRPLCIFFDDLQWGDTASLELLAATLAQLEDQNILALGAYRTDEIGPGHVVLRLRAELAERGLPVCRITLGPLDLADASRLIREMFAADAVDVGPLAATLVSRSEGNPLFLTQLVELLVERGAIVFDLLRGAWSWQLAAVDREAVNQDVLGVLGARLRTVEGRAADVLAVAACLGTPFAQGRLVVATALPDGVVEAVLADMCRDGLLVAASPDPPAGSVSAGLEGPAPDPLFRFLHDRIQQAALDLVPEAGRPAFRLAIGRRLLQGLRDGVDAEGRADVLANLNHGWRLTEDPVERTIVAGLNLAAARGAKQTLAYDDAVGYAAVGLELAGANGWSDSYDLCLGLHEVALECQYLSGNLAEAEQLLQALVLHARTAAERARAYLTKVLLDTSVERYADGMSAGIAALRSLRMRFARRPTKLHLMLLLVRVRLGLRGEEPADLQARETRPAPVDEDLVRILVALFPTAYFLSPDLLMYCGLKVVTHSLRRGIVSQSASGFVLYGLALVAALGDFRGGFQFGQYALELAERGKSDATLCKVLVIFSIFIRIWRAPIDDSALLIERARVAALAAGDHQYANYAIIGGLSLLASRGAPLADLAADCRKHSAFVFRSKDTFAVESLTMWWNFARALAGETSAAHSLSTEHYDEDGALARYRDTGNITLASYQNTLRLQLCYLAGRYRDAVAVARAGDRILRSVPGYVTIADHHLYAALAAARVLRDGGDRPPGLQRVIRRSARRLRKFGENAPQNFRAHFLLVEGERHRLAGRPADASSLFDQALHEATAQRQLHLEALAHELSGRLLVETRQRSLAAWSVAAAIKAYGRWGATAKVAFLRAEFSDILAPISRLDAKDEEARVQPRSLAGANPALRAGTREDGIAQLVDGMRRAASVETAYLILPSAKGLEIAESALDGERQTGAGYSSMLAHYVLRSGDDLLLEFAHADARFASCPYLAGQRPSLTLCIALRAQGDILGLVYLEQREKSLALAGDRLEIARGHAAGLSLALSSRRLKEYRQHVRRFAPKTVARLLEADADNPDLSISTRPATILFADIADYTAMSEVLGAERVDAFVNRIFSRFLDAVHRCNGTLLGIRGDEMFILFDRNAGLHISDAIRAAVQISDSAALFNDTRRADDPVVVINMGVASGEVAIGIQPVEGNTGSAWRYDATGPVVNLAARIRSLARDGQILLDDASAGSLAAEAVETIGPTALKNIRLPQVIHRLLPDAWKELAPDGDRSGQSPGT